MHPAEIKASLMLRGVSQRDIAKQVGVKPNLVSMVINGRSRSEKIEKRIATITGFSPADLWPQWHGPDSRSPRRPACSQTQLPDALRALAA